MARFFPARHSTTIRLRPDPDRWLPADVLQELLAAPSRFERIVIFRVDESWSPVSGLWLSEGCRDRVEVDLDAMLATLRPVAPALIALAHSHPWSLDPAPSLLDRAVTLEVGRACLNERLTVVDHLIYGQGGQKIFSFFQNGIPCIPQL